MVSLNAVLLGALLAAARIRADEVIYSDNSISSTWQDWSWSSTIIYNATDIAEGSSSISVTSEAYSALSLYDTAIFSSFAGLKFDIAGDNPDISIYITDTVANVNSPTVALSAFGLTVSPDNFTSFLMNFNDLPPNGQVLGTGNWNRITWQAGGSGATYHIDNIELVSEIVVTPEFLSAEPLATNVIAMTTKGNVDLSTVQVTLGGETLKITGNHTLVPANTPSTSITYLTLNSTFSAGTLVITAGNATFQYTLPASISGTVNQWVNYPISPHVYGIDFPPDADSISELGVTISRWGGNAETAYNPFGDFTNAGADWYFENRNNDDGSADDWIGWVSGAGSDTLLAIPALDWVAKDNSSYSYPKTIYPDQESFDPYLADAGDGLFPNGSVVTPPPNQTTAYVPWNTTAAKLWLSGLTHKPTIVTIDNEMEIASSTHSDMHPEAMGYDEELARVINFSTIAKAALPSVSVAAPSTCSWWFYWTSEVGRSDATAHNNTDFLPWFLAQMQAQEKSTGKRLLDYLDLHYYFQADTSAGDATAEALRLRMTRSWWDPTYVDESWIGTSTPQNYQPNATIVELIPRMQALIAQYYPGTKLSVSEWSANGDTDIVGGLVTADSLGIFGRYKLDSATYWGTVDPTVPTGLAFWLYRGNGRQFGNSSAQVDIPSLNPDTLGVYAGTFGGQNATLVVVNKDPNNAVALNLTGIAEGQYYIRHFGGQAGAAMFETTVSLNSTSYIVVPSYTAVFLQELVPCAPLYGQCGGSGWTGQTCCQQRSLCTPQSDNPFYSQCLP